MDHIINGLQTFLTTFTGNEVLLLCGIEPSVIARAFCGAVKDFLMSATKSFFVGIITIFIEEMGNGHWFFLSFGLFLPLI